MCMGYISLYMVWNKLLRHDTLAWVIIFSLLDFMLITLIHHYSSCLWVLIFFVCWFIFMIFYILDSIQSCFITWYNCWAPSSSFEIYALFIIFWKLRFILLVWVSWYNKINIFLTSSRAGMSSCKHIDTYFYLKDYCDVKLIIF